MGFFDFMKKKEAKQGLGYAPTMTGGLPFYAPFGDSVYASDIVVQSIRCKANEFKKLDPRHIRVDADGKQTLVTDSSVAKILKRPNKYMTMADFLEKITILLELNKTFLSIRNTTSQIPALKSIPHCILSSPQALSI